MTKRSLYIVLALLCGFCWFWYSSTNQRIAERVEQVSKIKDMDDPDGKVAALESELIGLEGQQTFKGILLTFLSAGVVGILFAVHVLPAIAQRFTNSIYDSGEMIGHDVMRDARSLLAQGEYEAAIEAFREAIQAEPDNRMPWMEIAKTQKEYLSDPHAAIETLRSAIESVAWPVDDVAFFMFRLAELYEEIEEDRLMITAIMQHVIDLYPGTRHAANARHKLQELAQDADKTFIAEQEREFLERMNSASKSDDGTAGDTA